MSRCSAIFACMLMIGLAVTASLTSPADADPAPLGCTPHPTIRVEQNVGPLGFSLGQDPNTGEAIPRPGSGVTGGSGTRDDPFLIEGWCLRSSTVANPVLSGIFIANTDAHLVIRGNTIDTAVQGSFGMYLWGVENVVVTGNTVEGQDHAGVRLRGSTDNVVSNNTFALNSWYGVMVDDFSTRNTVQDNHISLSGQNGVYILNGAYGNTARNNHFAFNFVGLRFFNAHNNLVLDNEFEDNHWGVHHSVVSSGNVIQGNNIEGSRQYGIENNVNVDIDARDNWWGCADGPGAPGCDDATGRLLTEPWLEEPNPDAGPR